MYPYFYILNQKIPSYHLLLLIAFIFGGLCLRWIMKKLGFEYYIYMIVIIISLICGLTGSHILNILETGNYSQIFSIDIFRSGMNFLGGAILTGIVLYFVTKLYKKIIFIELLAICCPAIVLGYSIGRIGCFLSGDGCYGIQTNLPWGMSFPVGIVPTLEKVHPTPLYESIFCLILFFIIMKIFSIERFDVIKYKIIYLTFFFFGIERFFIEFIRRNIPFYGLTQAQWISLAMIILSIPFFFKYNELKNN
jgi:phosphatidylglycerol---prolipoprotein diacylglyceryl transferase